VDGWVLELDCNGLDMEPHTLASPLLSHIALEFGTVFTNATGKANDLGKMHLGWTGLRDLRDANNAGGGRGSKIDVSTASGAKGGIGNDERGFGSVLFASLSKLHSEDFGAKR